MRRLHEEAERAKHTLSSQDRADIDVGGLPDGLEFHTRITRARFEHLCAFHFHTAMNLVRSCLRDASLAADDVDDVVIVGGSTRIPKIQSLLQHIFPGTPLNKRVNPDEAVAYGAAVQAAMLAERQIVLLHNVSLQDVTPLSLGIGLQNGAVAVLIKKNARVPTVVTRRNFALPTDDCTAVSIPVYEGESRFARADNMLGEFALLGLPRSRTGARQVEVAFSIDANGMLAVKATHRGSGKWRQIRVDYRNGSLTGEDVRRIKQNIA